MDFSNYLESAGPVVIAFGLKVLGALGHPAPEAHLFVRHKAM